MNNDIEVLVGKILSDEKFVKALAENPEQTLQEAGIEPTLDLIDALKGVDPESLRQLAATFGENKAAL